MGSIGQRIISWWQSSFSDDERDWMVAAYSPLTISVTSVDGPATIVDRNPLLSLLACLSGETAFHQLSMISTWFARKGGEHCAVAFTKKAIEFYQIDIPVLDRHFALHNQCVSLYRMRDADPTALQGAIAACEASIAIHEQAAAEAKAVFGQIPSHHCFRQLRIIEEKRGNLDRAIELCEMAKVGGWSDDWDKDIARLRRKRDKAV